MNRMSFALRKLLNSLILKFLIKHIYFVAELSLSKAAKPFAKNPFNRVPSVFERKGEWEPSAPTPFSANS